MRRSIVINGLGKKVKKPNSEKGYKELERVLDGLVDIIKDNDAPPLAIVMEIIRQNLELYDNERATSFSQEVSNREFVKYLMESNRLHQKDLAHIFGGQANVSKFLNRKRELKQIEGLVETFGVSADCFLKKL